MIDCRLSIISRGKGWESNILQSAKMEVGEGFARIYYQLDGDDCTLFLSSDRAEQVRRGSVDLRLTFVANSKTACIIGDDALRGGYEIFTTRLDCIAKSMGVDARIEYLSGGDRERVNLKIRAIALKKQ